MSNFEKAYEILKEAEYSGKEYLFVHKNKGESKYTVGGIYQKFNPNVLDWTFINNICIACGYDVLVVNTLENEKESITSNLINLNDSQRQIANNRLDEIDFRLKDYRNKINRASRMIFNDGTIKNQVSKFFESEYWTGLRLDEVHSQKIAEEIFLMSIVSGKKNGVKLAQRIVGCEDDGIIGDITIKCLNKYDENAFDKQYDQAENQHFDLIVEKNPKMAINLEGWRNRSALA